MTVDENLDPQRIVLKQLLGDFSPLDYGHFLPFRPGVDILPLYGLDELGGRLSDTTPSAALLRYEPGASVPTHHHHGYEHIFILQGSQSDAAGVYVKGTCVISPPGSRHAVFSEEGCLVLAVWNRPVEILDD